MFKRSIAAAVTALFLIAPMVHAGYQITPKSVSVPLKAMNFATGTWTYNNSSGIEFQSKGAADETSVITAPIHLPRRTDQTGVRINSIDVYYRNTTADLDAAPSATLHRLNLKAVSGAGTDNDATAITTTNNGVVTAAATDRKMTFTVSSPAFDYSSTQTQDYVFTLTLNAGATSAIRVYRVVVNYDTIE